MEEEKVNYDLLYHALGISKAGDEPYRDYYASGKECDGYKDLLILCEEGLMIEQTPPSWMCSADIVFRVTKLGKEKAVKHLKES